MVGTARQASGESWREQPYLLMQEEEKIGFSSYYLSLVVLLGLEPRALAILDKCSTTELHPPRTQCSTSNFRDPQRSQPTSQAPSPGSGISVRMQMEDQRTQSPDAVTMDLCYRGTFFASLGQTLHDFQEKRKPSPSGLRMSDSSPCSLLS